MKRLLLLAMVIAITSVGSLSMAKADTSHALVKVNGLVCDFCAVALEKVFNKKPEVSDIDVNLTKKVVKINFKDGQTLTDDKIRKGITDAGYNVVEITR